MRAAKQKNTNRPASKRSKVSQAEFPNQTLAAALRIAQAIWDDFAGKGGAPHEIAMALDFSPTSGTWRNLTGSAIAYGLTDGGYNASEILLTELGRRIVNPVDDNSSASARIEAVLKPRVSRAFFERYNKAKFPKDDIGASVLTSFGIPKDRAAAAFSIMKQNGEMAGIIHSTKSGPFVALNSTGSTQHAQANPNRDSGGQNNEQLDEAPESGGVPLMAIDAPEREPQREGPEREQPKQLFVAHGKNRKPLEDLKKILNEFKIPYKVAVDEAHKGRPISKKVAELMHECSAGIFVFTKDEKFLRENAKGEPEEIWRPSENVVYELGAAGILWERKIIILREDGVSFPTDFSDLGYITFKDGEISSKALEVLKELIALNLIKVTAS